MLLRIPLRKEAECEQLRQDVAKLQAQLKASEKRIDQLSSATGLVTEIYKKNAAYIQRAETAEKEAAKAKKRAAGLKLLARRRKNAMQKTKKENVGLSAEIKELKQRSSNKRSAADDIRQAQRGDATGRHYQGR
ncbi:hypothetical protein AAVH_14283 [Aphelenchoides avenae]|nr:hypothetical protein AAVH_14283 [Aphelenchus avenae]